MIWLENTEGQLVLMTHPKNLSYGCTMAKDKQDHKFFIYSHDVGKSDSFLFKSKNDRDLVYEVCRYLRNNATGIDSAPGADA